jgi:hypothetical protein
MFLNPEILGKGGGTLSAGSAAALLVFGLVMPKGELALLVLGVCENWHYRPICFWTLPPPLILGLGGSGISGLKISYSFHFVVYVYKGVYTVSMTAHSL